MTVDRHTANAGLVFAIGEWFNRGLYMIDDLIHAYRGREEEIAGAQDQDRMNVRVFRAGPVLL